MIQWPCASDFDALPKGRTCWRNPGARGGGLDAVLDTNTRGMSWGVRKCVLGGGGAIVFGVFLGGGGAGGHDTWLCCCLQLAAPIDGRHRKGHWMCGRCLSTWRLTKESLAQRALKGLQRLGQRQLPVLEVAGG